MELLLVRHGLAGEADPRAWPDDDLRPLTAAGARAFRRAARGIAAQGVRPTRIYVSPALRTRQTAALLAGAFGLGPRALVAAPVLHPSRDPGRAFTALARLGTPRAAALVGHEPWLGAFLARLLGCAPTAGIPFDKGGAALARLPDGFARARGRGTLAWLLTQGQLAALG